MANIILVSAPYLPSTWSEMLSAFWACFVDPQIDFPQSVGYTTIVLCNASKIFFVLLVLTPITRETEHLPKSVIRQVSVESKEFDDVI